MSTFIDAAKKNGVPLNLLIEQAYQESGMDPEATNEASGAQGLMQFMPATARDFDGMFPSGTFDPYDPHQAIWAGAAYMARLFKQFGSWDKALAAYNWGPGNVSRKGMERAPEETQNYVTGILARAGMPFQAPAAWVA